MFNLREIKCAWHAPLEPLAGRVPVFNALLYVAQALRYPYFSVGQNLGPKITQHQAMQELYDQKKFGNVQRPDAFKQQQQQQQPQNNTIQQQQQHKSRVQQHSPVGLSQHQQQVANKWHQQHQKEPVASSPREGKRRPSAVSLRRKPSFLDDLFGDEPAKSQLPPTKAHHQDSAGASSKPQRAEAVPTTPVTFSKASDAAKMAAVRKSPLSNFQDLFDDDEMSLLLDDSSSKKLHDNAAADGNDKPYEPSKKSSATTRSRFHMSRAAPNNNNNSSKMPPYHHHHRQSPNKPQRHNNNNQADPFLTDLFSSSRMKSNLSQASGVGGAGVSKPLPSIGRVDPRLDRSVANSNLC